MSSDTDALVRAVRAAMDKAQHSKSYSPRGHMLVPMAEWEAMRDALPVELLEPCALCGGEGSVLTARTLHGNHRVDCLGCGMVTRWCETVDDAVSAWNRRAE